MSNPRPRRNDDVPKKEDRLPDRAAISKLFGEIEAAGYEMPSPRVEEFRIWLRATAEHNLFFFAKFILGFNLLSPTFHKPICEWLTDFETSRSKLMMLPVGFYKTTLVSQSMPLHMMIQPPETDIYFPPTYDGGRGQNVRIVLGAENQKKARENLSVTRDHLETNPWLVWLWPHIIWDNINDAPRWSVDALEIPRTTIYKEATLTAYGIESPITGGHYDAILPDDIATITAAQSQPVMDTCKNWWRKSYTRLHARFKSLHIGIGTHQNDDDVYLEWQKRHSVEVMLRAIEEADTYGKMQPIWPERYPKEEIEKLRLDVDAITWSLWYMNRPVSSQFSAMDWSQLREFRWVGDAPAQNMGHGMPDGLSFDDKDLDRLLEEQHERMKTPLARFAYGYGFSPIPDNKAAMIKRFFGQANSKEFVEHMKTKYDHSPAQTAEKQVIEEMLGTPPRKAL